MSLRSQPFQALWCRSRNRHGGFTLIELVVVIAIAAILLTVAAPSFTKIVQRNRAATEVNSMVADLQFARGQAIKEGQPVSVCIANATKTACDTTATTWQSGWIVFSDVNGNGALDSGDTKWRQQAGFVGSDTFVADNSAKVFTYNRDGFLVNPGASNVVLTLKTTPVNSNATRCLTLTTVGRQTVASC